MDSNSANQLAQELAPGTAWAVKRPHGYYDIRWIYGCVHGLVEIASVLLEDPIACWHMSRAIMDATEEQLEKLF